MGFFNRSRSSSGSSSNNSSSNSSSNNNSNSNNNGSKNCSSTAESPSAKKSLRETLSMRPFGFSFSRSSSNGPASPNNPKHSRSSSPLSDSGSTSSANSSRSIGSAGSSGSSGSSGSTGSSGSAGFAGESSSRPGSRPAACEDREAHLRLPPAVFDCINTQLRALYTNANANGEACETCIVRDLAAAARTCRSWRNGLVPVIYRDIYITGEDSPAMRKKVRPKFAHGGRILLLQRTLAARSDYASHVRLLTLPEYSPNGMVAKGKERQAAEAAIATLIATCPNVESVHGVYVPFTGTTHSPVHAALATRPALREHLWLVSATVPLQYTDSQAFVGLHLHWRSLETLVMQGYTASHGGGGLNHLTFADIFAHLPSLRRLMVSRFHAYEFNDSTLLSLSPSLTHLRLGKLPGVTEDGLVALSSLLAPALHTLALIELDIRSLATVAALLANLRLENLTLLQTASPELPVAAAAAAAPVLASQLLQSLHWDILTPGPATVALAESIRAGHFPALRRLRAPADHSGILQAVCQPRDRILHPLDPSLTLAAAAATAAAAASASVSASASPSTSSGASSSPSSSYSRLLPRARLEAERRIVQARAASTGGVSASTASATSATSTTSTTPTTTTNTTPTTSPPPPQPSPPPPPSPPSTATGGGYDWMGWNGSARRWKIEQEKRLREGGGGVLGDPHSRVLYYLEPDVEGCVDAVCRVCDVVSRFGATARTWCRGGGGGSGGLRRWHQNRGRRRREEGALGLGILFS